MRVGSRKIKRVRTSTVQREELAAAIAVAVLAGVPVVSLSA